MVVFWSLATVMAAIAVAFVVVPLLRARATEGPSEAEATLEVLRAQRREIEADVAAGTLPAAEKAEALDELVERAADDLEGREATATSRSAPRRPWPVAIALGVLVPLLAFAVYLALGSPQATDPVVAAVARGQPDEKQIVDMVENLARKVRERPDDAKGWALLARSMAALGRFQESADAYEHLAKLTPGDAQVLADYADSLGMAQGRSLRGKPYELVKKALAIDPDNRKALALAGTAALDDADFRTSIAYWERLARGLPAESPDAPQVNGVIAEIRQRAAAAGKPLPAGPTAPVASATPPKGAAAAGSVTGSVSVAPEVAPRIKGDETVFVFARAEGGASRMPLAVVRAQARELPLKFALDDSMAMAPTAKLSQAAAVRIEVRVSRSGNAAPQAGDLVGASAVVKPGARDVAVLVDKVLP